MRDDVNLHILADASDKDRIVPLVQQPWSDFRYHTFTADTSRQQARWFSLQSPKAETYWPEAQVVFCTGESYVPTRKARLAVTLHDAAYFEDNAHLKSRSFQSQRLKWRLLFYRLSQKADMFHTVSQFSADRLSHFFPQMGSRMRVVPNGVAPHFFNSVTTGGELYLSQAGLGERPYILVPGGLHFRKNADLILKAAPLLLELFPELIVAVVNYSHPAYAARAAALSSNVRILGFVSDEALKSLYTSARVVWFPSLYEGFGLPVIEAMACGAPVVASAASSIPEVAGSAAVLVNPKEPQAHVEAIEYLLNNSAERERLSRAGRVRAAGFTWASSAQRLKLGFDELL